MECQPQTQTPHWDSGQWSCLEQADGKGTGKVHFILCRMHVWDERGRGEEHKTTPRPAMVKDLDIYTKVKAEIWGHET